MKHALPTIRIVIASLAVTTFILSAASAPHMRAAAPADGFGYGLVLAGPETANPRNWGFNWMKVFNGPNFRPSANVLFQVKVSASDVGNLPAVQQRVDDVISHYGANIDAYEIGNEVNLSSTFGWAASPIAGDYVQ